MSEPYILGQGSDLHELGFERIKCPCGRDLFKGSPVVLIKKRTTGDALDVKMQKVGDVFECVSCGEVLNPRDLVQPEIEKRSDGTDGETSKEGIHG